METNFDKSEWKWFVTVLKEEARELLIKVGSDASPQEVVESCLTDLQALAPPAAVKDENLEAETWTKVRERLLKAAYATRPYCVRCGECCTKGSPTLFEKDMDIFYSDVIRPGLLTTVRKGEIAYSNVTEEFAAADEEMVKIREFPETRTCIFFEEKGSVCTIYDSRPFQCRIQQCWNPARHEDVSHLPKLKRKALLGDTGPLWQLIEAHEERCSHAQLSRAVARLSATKGQTVAEVLEILRLDHYMREFVVEKFELPYDLMDFFFGRPLTRAVTAYGLKVDEHPDGSFWLTPLKSEVEQ